MQRDGVGGAEVGGHEFPSPPPPPKVMVTPLPSRRQGGERGLVTCQTPHVPEALGYKIGGGSRGEE